MAKFVPFIGLTGRALSGRSSNMSTPSLGKNVGGSSDTPQTVSGGKHGPGNKNAGVNNPLVPFPSSAPTDPKAVAGSNIPMSFPAMAAPTSLAAGRHGPGSSGDSPQTITGGSSGPGTANAGVVNGPLAGKYPAMPSLHP